MMRTFEKKRPLIQKINSTQKSMQREEVSTPNLPPLIQRAAQAPQSITPAEAAYLQRTVGNQALGRMLRMQRQEEDEEELQMKPSSMMEGGEISPDIEDGIQRAKGGGRPLSPSTQSRMGNAFNADFSGVKIHTGNQSDQLNQSIQARAFTTGRDIFFRDGAYNPDNSAGQELLAHELTHVVQQNGRQVQRIQRAMPTKKELIAGDKNYAGAGKATFKARAQGVFGIVKKQSTYVQILKKLSNYNKQAKKISLDQKLSQLDEIVQLCKTWDDKHKGEIEESLSTKGEIKVDKKLIYRQQALIGLQGRAELEKKELHQLEGKRQENIVGESQKGLATIGHQLEQNDPHHREPNVLAYCLKRYNWDLKEKGLPPSEFYTFVTELEKSWDKELVDFVWKHVRFKITGDHEQTITKTNEWIKSKEKSKELIPRISYFEGKEGDNSREAYHLSFSGNDISNESEGKFDGSKNYIYAMSTNMQFYAAEESGLTPMERHHSSFLGGQSVGAAGVLKKQGYWEINLDSGHYQPEPQHMINALFGLKQHGVALDSIFARPIFDSKKRMYGHHVFELITALKHMNPKIFNKIKQLNLFETSDIADLLKPYSEDKHFLQLSAGILGDANDNEKEKLKDAKI